MVGGGMRHALLAPLILVAIACQPEEPLSLREGKKAPDFSLPSAAGDRVSLSDFRGERAVLLYFSMGPG